MDDRTNADERSRPEWWEARYLSGDCRWDTGIVPPEIVALVDSGVLQPGWALDLGCGSGVTSRFLARAGFRVIGIDLAHTALRRAQRAAHAEGLPCHFLRANVAQLGCLAIRANLAVDIGCLHNLDPQSRRTYIDSLAAHLHGGAYYILYTFLHAPSFSSAAGEEASHSASHSLTPADLAAFAPHFRLLRTAHGLDRERHSAWFLMRRA